MRFGLLRFSRLTLYKKSHKNWIDQQKSATDYFFIYQCQKEMDERQNQGKGNEEHTPFPSSSTL